MEKAGVTIVSVPQSQIAEKAGKLIPGTTKKYSYRGFDRSQMVFNNQIAMNWEETVELAKLMMDENSRCDYGFFTEWWFSYGWSVGGDCMEYITDDNGKPYYKFTLGDESKNYIVRDDVETMTTTGGATYKGGEIVSYKDKATLTVEQKALCNELPSQREAFTEFCRLSAKTNITVDTVNNVPLNGYGVAMAPSTVEGVDYGSYFYTGRCGMYVDGRWAVTELRKMMPASYDWDVAPLPVYRSYNEDGTVKAHGVAAGHSGSMAVGIPSGSKNKNAAWLFIQYITGEIGQTAQSKEGFVIPNQMALAENDEIFLQPDKKPANSRIFIDAAFNERPGDWTYLKDGEWINIWAGTLNTKVRDGEMDLTTFFSKFEKETQNKLYTYNNYTK